MININIDSNIVTSNNFKIGIFFNISSYNIIILGSFTFSNDLDIFIYSIVSKSYVYNIYIMTFQITFYIVMYFNIFILDIFANINIIRNYLYIIIKHPIA